MDAEDFEQTHLMLWMVQLSRRWPGWTESIAKSLFG